ncbi:hypothetical protein [Paraliomyxa miuraensis]|uniref:hypothetical protein n=1 Tax=Paraliomyxa miuraensis TaxID=376150 RepID=UPI002257BDCB|nr:hypothetical protein [Paraliomyxa miuraensis]MCX4240863.1 hypothetical protein [Paraliomyxa miuraensis]
MTRHHDTSLLSSSLGRGLAAVLLASSGLSGCDAPGNEPSDRALELDEEDLDEDELDALAIEQEDADEIPLDDASAPAATETIADVVAMLPPGAIESDLLPEDLDRPVEVIADQMVIDVDGNGVIDGFDDLVTISDPMAIGEATCATTSIANPINGGTVAMSATPACGYAHDGSTSPDGSYNPANCPHQYITEVTGTYAKPLSFYWSWEGASLTQENCSLAHANLSAYGAFFNWIGNNTVWTKLGTSSMHGKWVSGPLFSYCGWEYDEGSGPLPSLGNHAYYKVRTAAQATGFIIKQRVEGGVTHGPGPC